MDFAPYHDEYSNELRNSFSAPHFLHIPMLTGPLGGAIVQWQLLPFCWHSVRGISSTATSSSTSFSLGFALALGFRFDVVMIVMPDKCLGDDEMLHGCNIVALDAYGAIGNLFRLAGGEIAYSPPAFDSLMRRYIRRVLR